MKESSRNIQLSEREQVIYDLHWGCGRSAEEVANETFRAADTVRKHISNIKKKLGLSKSSEISGYYWCEKLGIDYNEERRKLLLSVTREVKKQMFTILILIPFSYVLSVSGNDIGRYSRTGRMMRIETYTRLRKF